MTSFERLGGALQHHIVNSLGWRTLRPLQELAIEPLLDGNSALLLAPTAGGKTEAAVFPLLSRMVEEQWRPVSVLYICPIKALLNNLEHRLRDYTGWVGRDVGLWHGDVKASRKTRLLAEPPDILLITPESLEVLLGSARTDASVLFANVAAIIVDEIHAFAGDDRGWHLLAVLDRISALSQHRVQRVGLSATVGNPKYLLHWLTGGSNTHAQVISPPVSSVIEPNLTIDHVGNLNNAALVISLLHLGEKRLVFCDSRSRCEALASELRALKVQTFVSHSSLSIDERRRAEGAFAEARDCVIVATSTLELGIDVGDLDRVIQIDSPATVASFLQRLGRTGRRPQTARNCLFLATTDDAFMQTVALVGLFKRGYVEPIQPPALPFPVLAQQLMGLCLQERDLGRLTWVDNLRILLQSAGIKEDDRNAQLAHMIDAGFLVDTGGLLGLGIAAEQQFGHKHYMALYSVFNSPPVFTVLHGRVELGTVHETSFQAKTKDSKTVLSLAGRSWSVRFIDWQRRQAWVEPSDRTGRSRWLGGGQGLGFELCQSVKRALAGELSDDVLSSRSRAALRDIVEEHAWVVPDATILLIADKGASWYTFGGSLLNASIASAMRDDTGGLTSDSFAVHFGLVSDHGRLMGSITELRENSAGALTTPIDEETFKEMKFAQCVPPGLLARLGQERFSCDADWEIIRAQSVVLCKSE